MPFMTANSFWGLAKEGTYGTAASISEYSPIGSPKVTPTLKWLDDSDFRGSPVMHYDQVPGVRADKFEGKTFMYSDTYPNLIMAALGGPDNYAASVHTIGVLNSASTGSQAPSYTIVNNSVDASYQLTASRLIDMSISFAADAAVETTFSFAGNPASVVASVSPTNESSQHFVPAWDVAASINGASVAVVESGTLDIKRNTAPIHTIGQQGPYNNFQGPLDVMGQLVLVVEQGEQYWADALTRDQMPLTLQFNDPASGAYIQFQMSKVQLEDPVIDQAKEYVSLQTKFTAVANTIDGIVGYAPIKATVFNGVTSAY